MLLSKNIWLGVVISAILAGGCASAFAQGFPTNKAAGFNQRETGSHLRVVWSDTTQPQAAAAIPDSSFDHLVLESQIDTAYQTNAVGLLDHRQKLSPGDVIDIKVYQEDELASHGRIETDGTVTMPLLGAVAVGGKTVGEAAAMIGDLLARDYLVHPHVTLTVAEFAKKRFSVMGEVKVPGFYAIPENERINLLQALSMAGGYTAFSRGTRIQIKRRVNNRDVVLWVDAKAMARKQSTERMEIEAGDAITVNPNIF